MMWQVCYNEIQYIIGRVFPSSVRGKLKYLEYSTLLSIVTAEHLFTVL